MPTSLSWVRIPSPALVSTTSRLVERFVHSPCSRGSFAGPLATCRSKSESRCPHRQEDTDELVRRRRRRRSAEKLNLSIKVDSPSACERHVTVTIPREDIERYFDKAFSEMMATAAVPGFRAGRAPRKLVEARFRKDVADQVKGSLLMDSMTQITEDEKFTAISEPDFDPAGGRGARRRADDVRVRLEVRPEFDLPEWKGLKLERPVREFTKKDIDKQLEQMLAQHGQLVPFDGPAASRRLHHLQSDVQERRRSSCPRARKKSSASARC